MIGNSLLDLCEQANDYDFLSSLVKHKADLVRCWAAYTIGKNKQLNIFETLNLILPLAADQHFGVREIAWMAVRGKIIAELTEAIAILET